MLIQTPIRKFRRLTSSFGDFEVQQHGRQHKTLLKTEQSSSRSYRIRTSSYAGMAQIAESARQQQNESALSSSTCTCIGKERASQSACRKSKSWEQLYKVGRFHFSTADFSKQEHIGFIQTQLLQRCFPIQQCRNQSNNTASLQFLARWTSLSQINRLAPPPKL
jgi:hypothetical protein